MINVGEIVAAETMAGLWENYVPGEGGRHMLNAESGGGMQGGVATKKSRRNAAAAGANSGGVVGGSQGYRDVV
jgi:hypothetical protein